EYVIRARTAAAGTDVDDTQQTTDRISGVVDGLLGEGNWGITYREAVSPKVGSELRVQALMAVLLSFLAVLAYLAYRFEWRFGVAAVLATAHDILLTVCFIAVMKLEVGLVIVAAVLSTVGFSLNDTIVIFDRIREDLHKHKKESLTWIINKAVSERLPRTIMTNVTGLATIIPIAIFGGDVIGPFAIVMGFGVFVGTFSTIYIAGPALLLIEERWPGLRNPVAKAPHVATKSAKGAARPANHRVWIDTHCHLGDPAVEPDRDQVVEQMRAAGVGRGLVMESDLARVAPTAAWVARDPHLALATGCHPHDASAWNPELREMFSLRWRSGGCAAAGEMGLDYHYDHSPRDVQREVFAEQLALSTECGLPVVIHAREADDDVAGSARN